MHLDGVLAPHLAELPALDDPEQLRLEGQAELGHLVQQERAPIGQLEHALPVGHGRGEGALDVAEHLALHEPFGMAAQSSTIRGWSARGPA